MKRIAVSALTVLFALGLPSLALQAAPKLKATQKGVSVETPGMGGLNIAVPGMRTGPKDYKGQQPSVTLEGDKIICKYAAGAEMIIEVSDEDKTATYSFSKVPDTASAFVFSTHIGIGYKNGGQFSFQNRDLMDFPDAFEKQIVADGGFESINIVDTTGKGLTVQTPQGYNQIQDNRAFNWAVFSWLFNYTFKEHPGKTEFTFKFQDFKPKATASADGAPAPRKFTVDKFGQSARKDYPGKVTSEDELKADAIEQAKEDYTPNPKLDKYGGLAGSGEQYGLKKTGFFRADKVGDRHVLVTPEGNIFFQLSVCGIASTDDVTLVKGRENIYEWLPKKDDAKFLTAWRDQKPDWGNFSFYLANLIRKFDKPWTVEEWSGQVIDRLRMWGFNSSGAFSSVNSTFKEKDFPYVSFLPKKGVKMLPEKIGADNVMDPFEPGVAEALDKAYAESLPKNLDQPLLIGYMFGNEQHFEDLPKRIPAWKASKVASKAKLVEILQQKYGTIDKFNAAWKPAKPFTDFEELKEEPLFLRSDEGAADMREFFQLFLKTHYELVETTFRKHDKNHLLIGSRWTPNTAGTEDVVRAAGPHLDVLSINYYTYQIEKAYLDRIYEWSGGKPMLFTEWHYGATDQGLAAHKEVASQEERAKGYRNYIEQSAALPYVVGSQWFIYSDQSITGRFFSGFHGEGNNTGLVNVVDRPYKELVEAAKLTHDRVYDIMLGKVEPYRFEDPRFTGEGAGGKQNKKLAVPPAAEVIELDGSTKGWPGTPAEGIAPNRLVVGLPNPNLRADFRVTWTPENLHFHIQVKDASPMMNLQKGQGLWSGDGVEIFIGPKDLDKEGALLYADRQILIGANEAAEVHIMGYPDESEACRAIAIKDVSGDGYVIEAILPWKALGIDPPKTGYEMLFDVCVDFSEDGRVRTHQMAWNGVAANSKQRSAWGRLRLD